MLKAWLSERRHLVDEALRRALPAPDRWPKRMHEAMCYSLFGGGKRIRPVLVLAAFEAVGGARDLPYEAALPAACGVEMVHTYSLVHDDLPAMDDDDERRGRPTNHKQFGEGMAVLAGDALLTEAFAAVLDTDAYGGTADPALMTQVGRGLSRASGWLGMVGGQSLDLGMESPVITHDELAFLHRRKTGELFRFSCWSGALLGRGSEAQCAALGEYGETLGLSFQVVDDVLDELEDTTERADDAAETPSFPALIGLDASRKLAAELADRALASLEGFGVEADPLRRLAWFTVHRDH
ncbi:MAG: polyprenyl synthetase family protein [Deltaproteobacteria bacterium]|nr:polyprenyl synthetase family protein [Deltaproteobacteria bacterium]